MFQAGSGFLKLPAQGVRSGELRVILILASLVRSQPVTGRAQENEDVCEDARNTSK
jgi:hypothetical protein